MRTTLRILRFFTVIAVICTAMVVRAETFAATDLADEQMQTRSFETRDLEELLRASLSVIQDLNFFVTEVQSDPGLIVANSSCLFLRCAGVSLTVSVDVSDLRPDVSDVRVSLAGPDGTRISPEQAQERNQFYQNFFNHLDRTLSRRRQLP